MNKRERVINAFNRKEVDRVPVGFWFHFPHEQSLGLACVNAHLEFYNNSMVDFVKIMCDGYFPYPFSCKIKSAEDFLKLEPLGKNHPFIREQVERAKVIKRGLKDDMCVFYTVFAPFSSLRFGASQIFEGDYDAIIMQFFKENPAAIQHALSVIANDNATLSELLIEESGCDGIYYAVQGGEYDRFTYEEYRRLVMPSDLAVLTNARKFSHNNILHCCGFAGNKNQIEVWKDYPAKVVNWAVHTEKMSLKEGIDFFDGKCVMGGFDNKRDSVLCSASEAEIIEYTKSIIAETGKTGVILSGDCCMPSDIDIKRFDFVVEGAVQSAATSITSKNSI